MHKRENLFQHWCDLYGLRFHAQLVGRILGWEEVWGSCASSTYSLEAKRKWAQEPLPIPSCISRTGGTRAKPPDLPNLRCWSHTVVRFVRRWSQNWWPRRHARAWGLLSTPRMVASRTPNPETLNQHPHASPCQGKYSKPQLIKCWCMRRDDDDRRLIGRDCHELCA